MQDSSLENDVQIQTNPNSVLTIQYNTIPDLPEKLQEQFRKLDTDNNGEVALSEILRVADSNGRLSKVVSVSASPLSHALAFRWYFS